MVRMRLRPGYLQPAAPQPPLLRTHGIDVQFRVGTELAHHHHPRGP